MIIIILVNCVKCVHFLHSSYNSFSISSFVIVEGRSLLHRDELLVKGFEEISSFEILLEKSTIRQNNFINYLEILKFASSMNRLIGFSEMRDFDSKVSNDRLADLYGHFKR